jgi:hypothetical protein
MIPVEFKGVNVRIGEDTPQYNVLSALALFDEKGTIITAWKLSDEELETVNKTGIIYLQQLTFNNGLQPVYISAGLDDLAT